MPVYRHPRRLCRRECKKRLTYSYSNKSNLKLSMNLPDWNQIPSVVIFPMNTKTLVILENLHNSFKTNLHVKALWRIQRICIFPGVYCEKLQKIGGRDMLTTTLWNIRLAPVLHQSNQVFYACGPFFDEVPLYLHKSSRVVRPALFSIAKHFFVKRFSF